MSQQATPERIFGIGLLASVIASLMAGTGARIIMRIVALTAHMPPSFSIAGSQTHSEAVQEAREQK